jgi:predicted dehydrogenase
MILESEVPRPLKWGMVGGGKGSQIGGAHRVGAARDSLFELVAGVFDIDAIRGRTFGESLGLDSSRCYDDYKSMFSGESKRTDGIEVVSIATPNSTHYQICKAALEAGIHVVCEKPITFKSSEAIELQDLAKSKGLILGVMYGYCGYPMVHQARAMVTRGDIGEVRLVQMQFAHGYHASEVEEHDPGLKWRVSPEVAGSSYVLGDIGTHSFYMGSMITGLKVDELLCSRQSFIHSRKPLEDNAHVLLRYSNGAEGTLWASAVNVGSAHGQKIRVVGSLGSIEWWDEHPNQLHYAKIDGPVQVLERGMDYLHNEARFDRIGGGHSEGFFESWSNLYQRFYQAIDYSINDNEEALVEFWYPDAQAGVEGVSFVERCVESADNHSKWVKF